MGYSSIAELIAVRPADTPTNQEGAWVVSPPTVAVSAGRPLVVRACDEDTLEVVLLSPALVGGWHLLGEPSKWVSVSSKRFLGVVSNASSATAWIAGAAGEEVTLAWFTPTGADTGGTVLQQGCSVGASGHAACTVSL